MLNTEDSLLTRDAFRNKVFERDGYQCVFCGQKAKDAHHILERRLFSNGGYYLNNGASVCELHHLECEKTNITVEQVRHACGIEERNKVIPEDFYRDVIYDKWGNVLNSGWIHPGPLFWDESVQKILKQAGKLECVSQTIKYPRTHHVPWSPGITTDDRVLKSWDVWLGKRIVITEKMDGENTSLYSNAIHARSLDSRGGVERDWVKTWWAKRGYDLPQGWRICGENLWAKHSLHYVDLASYFFGFSIWNEKNHCLSWKETQEWFEILGVESVPVLWQGCLPEDRETAKKQFESIARNLDCSKQEGYVIRPEASFGMHEFKNQVGKWVRKNHVQTKEHWKGAHRVMITNELKSVKSSV